jgi:hypothetical protein
MSENYDLLDETSAGGEERTTAGGVILVFVSFLAAVLVIAGLVYATGTNARTRAELAVNDCEPTLYLSAMPCITQQMLISQYEAIVTPASRQLDAYMATYRANETDNLGAAEAALRAEVTTERTLDNGLAGMMFTPPNQARAVSLLTTSTSQGVGSPIALFSPQETVMADALVHTNQALLKLTAEQAQSSSLTQLRSFNSRVDALSATVRKDLTLIRKALAVRPTASQEP